MSIAVDPITFTVYGEPQTAGSKRAFPFQKRDGKLGVAVSDDNKRSKPWQAAIAQAAAEAYSGELLDGPLAVTFTFYRPRPKGHYGSGRNAGVVKDSAPDFPTTKPDVLKLARCAEDALTGVVWRDDSQIVSEKLLKRYGEPARLEVWIYDPYDDECEC